LAAQKNHRAVPEVVKSKENLAYLKDFISKVGYENSSEVCFIFTFVSV
jgi:hypothetical protein